MTRSSSAPWILAVVFTATAVGTTTDAAGRRAAPDAALVQGVTGRDAPRASGLRAPASFEGELPCADCPGIRVHLDLYANGTFLLRRTYRDRPRVPDRLGRWVVSSDRAVLRLHTDGVSPTLMGLRPDGILAMLDADGRPIVSSSNTRLERLPWFWPITRRVRPMTAPLTTSPLVDTTWRLVRLAHQDLDGGDANQLPFLTFSEQGRFAGSTGCNRVTGGYTLDDHALTLPAVATTRMACATGSDVEAAFLEALDRTVGMRLVGDWLELTDEAGEMQARFAAGPPSR